MQISEQQQISSVHKGNVFGDWKAAAESCGAEASGSNFNVSGWIRGRTELVAKHKMIFWKGGERRFSRVPVGFPSRKGWMGSLASENEGWSCWLPCSCSAN